MNNVIANPSPAQLIARQTIQDRIAEAKRRAQVREARAGRADRTRCRPSSPRNRLEPARHPPVLLAGPQGSAPRPLIRGTRPLTPSPAEWLADERRKS
jgi:hypothetical protein